MELLSELTKRLELNGNEDMLNFAKQTWQQLEEHAAQGPDSYRKFQDAQLSAALGNARPEKLSDRKALLKIDTSIVASGTCLLVDTAQVSIRIYRASPSLAVSMCGSLARSKSQTSTQQQAVKPKLLWQSAKLTADAKGIVIVDIECSAKAVDAVLEKQLLSSKLNLLPQVLQYLQQHTGVKLAVKSAKLSVLAPGSSDVKAQSATGRNEDLSQIPAASSNLPASLLSKLSMVKPEEDGTHVHGSKDDAQHIKPRKESGVTLASKHAGRHRPLIEEL